MATQLAAFPVTAPEKAYETHFPWDQWLDGTVWELTWGVDFDGTTTGFRTQARFAAQRRGFRLRDAQTSPNTVVVQALPGDTPVALKKDVS